MKKTLRLLLMSLFVLFALTRCIYEEIPEPVVPETVSFSTDIVPIFVANCNATFCHAQGAEPPDLTPDNAWEALQDGYVNIDNPESSELVTKMDGGSMAPYSSDQDIALIIKWITDGAHDN